MRSVRFLIAWMLAVVAGVAAGLVIASAVRHGSRAESVRTIAATAVAAVRTNGNLAATLSTVDDVGAPQGKLVSAWALADQLGGRVGHYGTGPGATSVLPATRS